MFRIIILIFMHAAADFILQGSGTSRMKASKIAYLFAHVGIYTSFFIALSPVLLGLTIRQGIVFSLINGGAHFIIDFVTSKVKVIFWNKNEVKYFAAISFDQALHIAILLEG